MNRQWNLVFMAGIFEIGWVVGLKHSQTWLHWLATIIGIVVSFTLLIQSSRRLPVSTVYAVFAGLGTAGTVLVETVVFGVSFHWLKLALIALLLFGVIGLKLVTDSPKQGAVD